MTAAVEQDRREQLLARAREIDWYHSMELVPGVRTEGHFDLMPVLDRHGLPESMEGMRVIDVGTYNGFWAFEMERRGAEVVALDLASPIQVDWPAFRPRQLSDEPMGEGFQIARELRGSNVERIECSIYEATPEALGGTFDFAFCGSMLIHLRDQFAALERINSLLRDGGTFISAEPYSRGLGLLGVATARYKAHHPGAPVFWEPTPRTWRMMLEACGFSDIEKLGRFRMNSDKGYHVYVAVHRCKRLGPPARDASG